MRVKVTNPRFNALLAALLLSAASGASQAQTGDAWVSDELTTYVRSGPTDGYRIIGTLSAGEQVQILENSGDYSRVRNNDGEVVWVLSSELQQTPSAREQLPELEEQVESLSTELEGINDEWEQRVEDMSQSLDTRQQRIDALESSNQELASEAEQSRQRIRELQARLETQEEDLLLRYFMYGGGVAGAGLLVGLIIPHLPRRRKKRDRWF
ncbi:TIGR04211 family SH3 domain-containing protein [Halomonas sp. Bachu 37]|uniref:TIGR04211 family SH3 domain-containing protein n=1 Tax=Halomonas kashgarensis TaxID=3084920 RepID=UPI0032164F35